MTQFVPIETFENVMDGRKSRYLAGMAYTVRPGNDALAALVDEWLKAGKVTVDASAVASAPNRIGSGPGTVKGTVTTGKKGK